MFHLKRNLPVFERLLRLGLGACAAFATYRLAPAGWGQFLGYATAATLACTAAVGFCPACAMFGRAPVCPKS